MSNGYFESGDKISKVTEDGLRINVYRPSGIVTNQQPGSSHGSYASQLPTNFKDNLAQSNDLLSNWVSLRNSGDK